MTHSMSPWKMINLFQDVVANVFPKNVIIDRDTPQGFWEQGFKTLCNVYD